MRRLTIILIAGAISTSLTACGASSSYCEQLWEENQSTASSSYMTKDRYITNCEQTNDDLRSGRIPR